MANNSTARNWSDIQIALAAMGMALTLGLWNLFAEPDRSLASKSVPETATASPPGMEAPSANPTPAQVGPMKILLGGKAPQTTIVVQQSGGRRNNGGGGGGGSTATTRSS